MLGLRELDKPQALRSRGGAWFELGSGQIHIGVEQPFLPALKAHPALRLADGAALERLAERVRSAGAPVRWDTTLPGVVRFFTADPWGNRLELLAPT